LYFHKVGHVVLGRTPCMNVIDPTMPLIQAWVSQCILRHDAARSYMQLKDHQQVLCPMCMVWPFALPLNPGRRRSASRTWSGSFVGVGRFCGIHRKDGLQGILSTSPQQQAHCTSQHLNPNHHTESRCCPQLSERKQIPTISTRRTGRPQEGCRGKYNSVIVKIHRAPVYLGRGDHKILGPSQESPSTFSEPPFRRVDRAGICFCLPKHAPAHSGNGPKHFPAPPCSTARRGANPALQHRRIAKQQTTQPSNTPSNQAACMSHPNADYHQNRQPNSAHSSPAPFIRLCQHWRVGKHGLSPAIVWAPERGGASTMMGTRRLTIDVQCSEKEWSQSHDTRV
jgi:hypothetical protein